MTELERYDEIISLLKKATDEIDNNDLEQADKYLEQARDFMREMSIYE